jgi:hypothetical protein
VEICQRPFKGGHVVLADLVEGDEVWVMGSDHRGGFGHRLTGVASTDAAVAEVHLEHTQLLVRHVAGRC